MKENVLDVLIYLFENGMFEDDSEPDQDALMDELSRAGFGDKMIDQAFDWLENLAHLCEQHAAQCDDAPRAHTGGIRQYSAREMELLDAESRGLLLSLEQCGVLDPASREMVVNQIIALGGRIDLDQVKWVILMVLSNYSEGGGVSELTESLVLDGLNACVH